MKVSELLTEKVHTLPGRFPKKGAPEEKARVFSKRKNHSVLAKMAKENRADKYFATGDADDFGDEYGVLVMATNNGEMPPKDYKGINVTFRRDGTVVGGTWDEQADAEWKKDRKEIIRVAREFAGDEIKKFMKGEVASGYTTLPRGKK